MGLYPFVVPLRSIKRYLEMFLYFHKKCFQFLLKYFFRWENLLFSVSELAFLCLK